MIMQVVMRLLMDKGEAMLCEEYTYPHIAESMVQPQGYTAIPLAMDAEGIIPCTFRTTLQSLRDAGKQLPKLLYTIPVGQNPTGQPLEPQDLANDFTGFLCNQFVQHAEQQCACCTAAPASACNTLSHAGTPLCAKSWKYGLCPAAC